MSYYDEQFISFDYHLPATRSTAMHFKFVFATLAVLIGVKNEFVIAEHIPPTTTAAELWNPWTWFWPYAIAAAEGYRDYFQKAQKATNELYQQAEKVNAFPWITGKPSAPQGNNQGGNGGQNNQGPTQPNQNSGTGQNNQAGPSQPNQNSGTGQNNQAGPSQPNQSGNETPPKDAPEGQDNNGGSSPNVQVQGNTQEDGKTDAGVGVNA